MRRILIPAAVGVLSLFLANPAQAGHGGGGGGGGGGHGGGGGGGHPGGGGGHYGGGYGHPGYGHYGYPGVGIGIGVGFGGGGGYGYGLGYPYYDSAPIYAPPLNPTIGPGMNSYYPPDAGVIGNAIGPAGIAPPPVAMAVPPDEAYIRVLVPDANAEVLLEGKGTDVLGRDRLFSSPKLDPGSKYSYTVTATWVDQGHVVHQTREVPLTPGQTSIADFRRPQ
jgi:uncharacterized protein (TIGR03000 family)